MSDRDLATWGPSRGSLNFNFMMCRPIVIILRDINTSGLCSHCCFRFLAKFLENVLNPVSGLFNVDTRNL